MTKGSSARMAERDHCFFCEVIKWQSLRWACPMFNFLNNMKKDNGDGRALNGNTIMGQEWEMSLGMNSNEW